MTISELIEKLSKFPGDLPVYKNDAEWGPIPTSDIIEGTPNNDFWTHEPRPPGVVIK